MKGHEGLFTLPMPRSQAGAVQAVRTHAYVGDARKIAAQNTGKMFDAARSGFHTEAAHYENVLASRDYFSPIPEPGTMTLALLGLTGVASMGRRRRSRE